MVCIESDENRVRQDLSGYWTGRLVLNPELDVAAPTEIEQDFYLPLPWNLQVESLKWPRGDQELSGIVTPVQNQNFREWQRKFAEGTITLRRTVHCENPAGKRVFLVLEGSNYRTTLRVNDEEVGSHDGGHLAFEFEVTEPMRAGTNEIELEVDNLRRKEACPQEQFNWQNYGGVYRPLYLEFRPRQFMRKVRVTPGCDESGWFVDVAVSLDGADGRAAIEAAATSGEACGVLRGEAVDGEWRGTLRLEGEPRVWRLGDGGLSDYRVTMTTADGVCDAVGGTFGLRTVELQGGAVLLNGHPVRILGAAWHEQHPVFGNAVPGWQVRRDIQLMKQCGLNTIRAAHYPHAQSFYEACDREGMLCFAELPCWQFNADHFASPVVLNLCKRFAGEMVEQLGNHPSVIGWIVQNESKTFEENAHSFLSEIAHMFKRTDPSRFTLSADHAKPPEHLAVVKQVKKTPTGPPPPTHDCVDVLGLNDYSGWYGEKSDYLPKLLDHVHAHLPDKPLIMTEFGAEGIPGQRSLALPPWSEDYQAELICRHIRAILDRPFMAGFVLWLFIDYEAASIGIRGINAKGLVDEWRRPKLAFNQVKQLLDERMQE